MYTNEGLRRIHLLGKRIMLFGTLAAVVFWLLATFVLREPGNTSIAPFELLILIIYPLLLGGTLWVIAWIVEGFLTSSSTSDVGDLLKPIAPISAASED